MILTDNYRGTAKRGFTLIELLVVIAIIALLAAILFPVFARARENARKSSCLNNMKQLGLAFQQYSQDYDESYFVRSPYQPATCFGPGWAGSLLSYTKSIQLYQCPSDSYKPGGTISYFGHTDPYLPISYAYNRNVPNNPAVADHVSPAKTVLLFESKGIAVLTNPNAQNGGDAEWGGGCAGNEASPAGNGGDGAPNTAGAGNDGYIQQNAYARNIMFMGNPLRINNNAQPRGGDTAGRHLSTSNFLFLDGHVKALGSTQVSSGNNAATSTSAQDNPSCCAAAGTQTGAGATFSIR